jgi:hypothetical protein
MRTAVTVTLGLLLLPVVAGGQTPATSATGHFEGWLSDASWGADKQTFEARFGVRRVEATFTVAGNGFGWRQTFTDMKETFSRWGDVTAWCSAPGIVALRTKQDPSPRFVVYELKPADLATIVDGYFKKYAAETEWRGPGFECTPARLNGPHPTGASKIRDLLEAAATEQR